MYRIIYIPPGEFECHRLVVQGTTEAQEKWDALSKAGAEMRTDRPR